MKVKVGNKIYDGEKESVMVILTDKDKKNIANMLPECTKYMSYPDGSFESESDALVWMKMENDILVENKKTD